jgi:hypothetical protein
MLFLVGTYTWDDLDVRSTITTSGLSPAYMLLDVTPEFYEDEDIEIHDQWSGALVGYENLTADQVEDDSQEILDWVDDELFRGQLVSQLGRTYWDYKMEDSWLVATGVRMSLFDGGIKKEMVHQTLLDEERSTNDLQILQDTITLENKKAHFSYQQAKDRIAVLDNAIAQADEVLRLVRKRADLGLAASFEESDAEHALHNARSGRINAFFDAWLAKAELDHAMGIVY